MSLARTAALAASFTLAFAAHAAERTAAATFPGKPVRLLVPAPPGGSTDLIGRVVGAQLAGQLGQQVVIDNRGGAGGIVATELVARSVPDGHTLGIVYTPHTTNPSLTRLPYDPVKDFSPLSLMTEAPLVLTVTPALPAKTLKDLLALAKAKPLVYGSAGNGSGGHLSGELLKLLARIDATHVPFKGAAPAAVEVVAGRIHFQFAAQITVSSFLKNGQLRALAVTSRSRTQTLPDVPTVAEAGVPGFEFTNWFGIVGPARMPDALVKRINAEVVAALRTPEVRDRLVAQGSDVVASTPEHFRDFIRGEIPKWARVTRAAGMKFD